MLQISQLKNKHIEKCLVISGGLLGNNFHNLAYFQEASFNNTGSVASYNDILIGFLIYKNTPPNNLCQIFNFKNQTGCIDSICVSLKSQKKGIGKKLIDRALLQLKEQCKNIIVASWEYNGINHLEKLLTNTGFEKLYRAELLWKEACEKNEFNCPVKKGKCICSADIFRFTY